jgi:hypothetical protein
MCAMGGIEEIEGRIGVERWGFGQSGELPERLAHFAGDDLDIGMVGVGEGFGVLNGSDAGVVAECGPAQVVDDSVEAVDGVAESRRGGLVNPADAWRQGQSDVEQLANGRVCEIDRYAR